MTLKLMIIHNLSYQLTEKKINYFYLFANLYKFNDHIYLSDVGPTPLLPHNQEKRVWIT
jgi:hypothetical protein